MIIKDEFLKCLEIVGYDALLIIENANVKFYSCEIADSIPSVVIRSEPENPDFHCEGDLGEVSIRKGVNTFSVRVLQGETIKMEYKISIVLKKSASNAGLAGVEVDGDEAEPVMKNGEIEHFYYKVLSQSGQITIEAFPEKPDIRIEGDIGEQEIEPGMNCFDLIATSGDEKVRKNYQLLVEYQPLEMFGLEEDQERDVKLDNSDYHSLESDFLYVNETEPFFDAEIEAKDAEDTEDTEDAGLPQLESVIVVGITEDSQLKEENFLTIMATGGFSETFFKDHMMNDKEILSIPLIPDFAPEITDYLLHTEKDVSAIFIAAYPYDYMDLVTGDVGYQELEDGENKFTILVMGSKGGQQYHINVYCQRADDEVMDSEDLMEEQIEELPEETEELPEDVEPGLSYIAVEHGRLEPDFSSEIADYEVFTDLNLSQIQIGAAPIGDNCIVAGDIGANEVLDGENIYIINVFSKNRSKQIEYRIHYTKKPETESVSQEKERTTPKKKKEKKKKNRTWNLKLKLLKNKVSSKEINSKKAVRTTKLIHRLIVIVMFMCAASYLLNTFVLVPVRATYESRQRVQNETLKTRQALEQHLKNRSGIEKTIAEYEARLEEFGEAYPNVASQEEILLFLNELNTRIPFDYNIISIDVPVPVYSSDFANEVLSKDMAAAVPDITAAIPPATQPATPSESAAGAPSGTQAAASEAVMQKLQRNRATIAISGTYDIVMQVYSAIIDNPRIVITDNIQLAALSHENPGIETTEADIREWQLNLDLIFYSYTGSNEDS